MMDEQQYEKLINLIQEKREIQLPNLSWLKPVTGVLMTLLITVVWANIRMYFKVEHIDEVKVEQKDFSYHVFGANKSLTTAQYNDKSLRRAIEALHPDVEIELERFAPISVTRSADAVPLTYSYKAWEQFMCISYPRYPIRTE